MRQRTILAGLGAALAMGAVASAGAGAQSAPSGTLELVQRERDVRSGFVDNPPRRRESAGDAFTVAGPVRDTEARKVGRVQAVFTQTGRRTALGSATFLLRGGRLTIAGALAGSGTDELVIAGGTGAYAGARGTVTLREASDGVRFRFAFAG